jgi:hypothetical protein
MKEENKLVMICEKAEAIDHDQVTKYAQTSEVSHDALTTMWLVTQSKQFLSYTSHDCSVP